VWCIQFSAVDSIFEANFQIYWNQEVLIIFLIASYDRMVQIWSSKTVWLKGFRHYALKWSQDLITTSKKYLGRSGYTFFFNSFFIINLSNKNFVWIAKAGAKESGSMLQISL
jgi:hypothetical protein